MNRLLRLVFVTSVALCAVGGQPLLAADGGSAATAPMSAPAGRTPSPAGAKVYFIGLADGGHVTSPIVVRFGLVGMGVAPAGVSKANTGHHHLIVDAPQPALDAMIPKDEHHMHFGGGQTETVLNLAPGQHTLQLVFADANHVPHDPPVASSRITITVDAAK